MMYLDQRPTISTLQISKSWSGSSDTETERPFRAVYYNMATIDSKASHWKGEQDIESTLSRLNNLKEQENKLKRLSPIVAYYQLH